MIAVAAVLVSLAGFAIHRFDENGLRLGNQFAWRFSALVYFAAIIAGPIGRLVPWQALRRTSKQREQLIWGFCASFGIYLATLIVPNTFAPLSPGHEGLTLGMALMAIFGTALALVVAYAAAPKPALGERSRRAILGVGLVYFWLAYTLADLSHLSGSHRPDRFYGASLVLMLLALLMRFADNFVAKMRGFKDMAQS